MPTNRHYGVHTFPRYFVGQVRLLPRPRFLLATYVLKWVFTGVNGFSPVVYLRALFALRMWPTNDLFLLFYVYRVDSWGFTPVPIRLPTRGERHVCSRVVYVTCFWFVISGEE